MSQTKRNRIFISYSHQDEAWLDEIKKYLYPLPQGEALEVWDDRRIKAGTEWREEIRKAIDEAQIALLLVSQDFLHSKFIMEKELPPILENARHNGLRVLWVAVRPSVVENTPIEAYQALNKKDKPLSSFQGNKNRKEEELVRICNEIRKIARELSSTEAAQPAQPTNPANTTGAKPQSSDPVRRDISGRLIAVPDEGAFGALDLPEEYGQQLFKRWTNLSDPQKQLLSFIGRTSNRGPDNRGFVSHEEVELEFIQKYSRSEIFYRLEHLRLLNFIERRKEAEDKYFYRLSEACFQDLRPVVVQPPMSDFQR